MDPAPEAMDIDSDVMDIDSDAMDLIHDFDAMDIDPVSSESPIMKLPVELLLMIASYLPAHSVMLFGLTCKRHWQIPSEEIFKQLGPGRLEGDPDPEYLNARRYFLLYLYRDMATTHRLFTWNSGLGVPRPACNFWELRELQSEREFRWTYANVAGPKYELSVQSM
ncbi:hypothetical protein QBC41DRAFT_336387 [Cercophora samala]|uniref:F-box domain-containing protein n=1 Tax=Cercophora samala TaxID=330535 RepID=A0AA40DB32_9PEZI|nr:hypothetical protein QBC41DRAFT_336387 [Cercophora samala]